MDETFGGWRWVLIPAKVFELLDCRYTHAMKVAAGAVRQEPRIPVPQSTSKFAYSRPES
jgi:hypothetical protein